MRGNTLPPRVIGGMLAGAALVTSCSPSQNADPTPTTEAPPVVGFPDLSAFTESGDEFVQEYVPRVQGFGDWSVGAGYLESGTIEPLSNDPGFAAEQQKPPLVLAPMHKVTSHDGVAVCGVDDSDTVACRVDDHGFVITPTETKVF